MNRRKSPKPRKRKFYPADPAFTMDTPAERESREVAKEIKQGHKRRPRQNPDDFYPTDPALPMGTPAEQRLWHLRIDALINRSSNENDSVFRPEYLDLLIEEDKNNLVFRPEYLDDLIEE